MSCIAKLAFATIFKQRESLATEGRDEYIGQAVVIVIAEIGTHTGDGFAVVQQGNTSFQSHFFKHLATFVMEQEVGQIIVGDNGIHKTVAIIISKGYRHAATSEFIQASGRAHILKLTVAQVAIQLIGNGRKVFRMAIDADAFCRIAAEAIEFRSPLGVVYDEQIK